MSGGWEFLRAHPAVFAILAGLVIVGSVFGILAFLMARAGLSLRPLVFVAVFIGIVAGPQAAFHLGQALGWIPKRDLTWLPARERGRLYGYAEQEASLAIQDGRFARPDAVFGPDADPGLISDLRAVPGGPFAGALAAQMAVLPPSSTLIAARFGDAAGAAKAAEHYLLSAFGRTPPPANDGTWTLTRPAGDVAKVLQAGRTLVVLTGPDEAGLEKRLRDSQIVTPHRADPAAPHDAKAFTRDDYWLFRPGVLPGLAVLLVLIASVWFFKGSAWAAAVPGDKRVKPETAYEIRRRLLAINQLDVPFSVEEESPGGRLIATWRFVDAKWLDLARARGKRATHRVLLQFDEAARAVRPTDQVSILDWSAGPGGGTLQWRKSVGITFFQVEHERGLALQLNERGERVPRLSYSYTFNLQELKGPLIAAVTAGGWDWRPSVWPGPKWLAG